jgi:penicillin-binding protein 1A
MIADPSAYDPIVNTSAAKDRRNLVLRDMLDQHFISRVQYEIGIAKGVPSPSDLQPPTEPAAAPYFTSWLRPQILAAMGDRPGATSQQQQAAEYRAYYGGLRIRTTLDLKLQQAADQAIAAELPSGQGFPTVSMVAIDNRTGEVRAMVGGPVLSNSAGQVYEDYQNHPFNLATEAERQPGSSFKPFTLAAALEHGFGPSSLLVSAPLDIVVPHSGGREIFHVHNFGNAYSGVISLQAATDVSDNSAFERLGWYGLGPVKGTHEIRKLAQAMGIQSDISTNPAMILGGLTVGVNPLEMAHAYETFAAGGRRVYNRQLGSPNEGPTGIAEIQYGHTDIKDIPHYRRVMPAAVAQEVHNMLSGVITSGTGTAAAISGVVVAGKTGTTTNYADAWFVGWTPQLTTAVWVGFPDKLVPMTTLFNGQPVEGGTYPAIIWHSFMIQALQILASEQPASKNQSTTSTTLTTLGPSAVSTTPSSAPATTTTTPTGGAAGNGGTANSAPTNGGGGPGNTGAGTGNGTGAGAGTGAGTGSGAGTGTGPGTGAGGTGTGSGGGSGSGSGGAGIGGGH